MRRVQVGMWGGSSRARRGEGDGPGKGQRERPAAGCRRRWDKDQSEAGGGCQHTAATVRTATVETAAGLRGPPVGARMWRSPPPATSGATTGATVRGGLTDAHAGPPRIGWGPPHTTGANRGGGGRGGGGRGESREWAGEPLVHLAAVGWHSGGAGTAVSTSGNGAAGHDGEWNRVGGLGRSGVGVLIGQGLGDAGHLYSPAHKRGQAMGRRTNGHGCEWTSRRKKCARTATVRF